MAGDVAAATRPPRTWHLFVSRRDHGLTRRKRSGLAGNNARRDLGPNASVKCAARTVQLEIGNFHFWCWAQRCSPGRRSRRTLVRCFRLGD